MKVVTTMKVKFARKKKWIGVYRKVIHQPSGASSITWGQYRGLHMRRFFNCEDKPNRTFNFKWEGQCRCFYITYSTNHRNNDIIGDTPSYTDISACAYLWHTHQDIEKGNDWRQLKNKTCRSVSSHAKH